MKFAFLILALGTLFSCSPIPTDVQNVIDKSGSNKKELIKTIEHYKKTGEKQKLKAAYFLISNMEDKYGVYYPENSNFFKLLESVDSLKKLSATYDKIDRHIKSLVANNDYRFEPEYIKDINYVTSDYLIENIDMAFYVWQNKPWAQHITFDEFCEWILPYRINNEPLQNWRRFMYEELTPGLDSISNVDSACLYVNSLIAEDYHFSPKLGIIPYLGGVDAWNNRQGLCDHRYQLIVMAMRSVGVPAAIDFTPHFNREPMGHSWTVILSSNKKRKSFNGGETWAYLHDSLEVPIDPTIKGISTTFYRKCYSNKVNKWVEEVPKNNLPSNLSTSTIKEVSEQYKEGNESLDLTFNLKNPQKHSHALLFVFSKGPNLVPVTCAKINNGQVVFKNVGGDCLYVAGYLNGNRITIDSNPVYASRKQKTIEEYTLNTNKKENVVLYRKHHVKYMMNLFASYMVGSKIQGANNANFSDAKTLYTINDTIGYYKQINISNSNAYRYYRYISDSNKIRIAEVNFYNKNKQIKGLVYGNKNNPQHDDNAIFKNAFDNNIRTNFNAPQGSWAGIKLNTPQPVTSFKILARNNFNIVEPGDTYELLYFDKSWHSLETKVAQDYYIEFNNVPVNAILLLRNRTKGSEERIFKYKDGQQEWF